MIMPIENVSADAISSALSALISWPPTVTPVVATPAQTGHQKPATRGNRLPRVASAEPLIWKVFELIR